MTASIQNSAAYQPMEILVCDVTWSRNRGKENYLLWRGHSFFRHHPFWRQPRQWWVYHIGPLRMIREAAKTISVITSITNCERNWCAILTISTAISFWTTFPSPRHCCCCVLFCFVVATSAATDTVVVAKNAYLLR